MRPPKCRHICGVTLSLTIPAKTPGTVIIDTPNTQLYYVLGGGKAISYGIGVGRDGFTWSGVQAIARKAEWPDWIPPAEMIQRQPYLPRFMAGGPGNPLGARALYLGNTAFRIHGTNAPETIGRHVSSGCIRMVNDDVIDLYGRVGIGTKVIVLPDRPLATTRVVEDRQPIADRAPPSSPSLRIVLSICKETEKREPGHPVPSPQTRLARGWLFPRSQPHFFDFA